MVEKGDKIERDDRIEKKEKVKGKGITFLQVLSLLLIIVLIVIVLIVIQVPYTTTNAVSENVPIENCTPVAIPFVSNFRTGFSYDTSSKIYSSAGQAIYRYSDLNTYTYINIMNSGEESGIYCLNAQAYSIDNFNSNQDSLAVFQNLLSSGSDTIKQIDNWSGNTYTYPVCTPTQIARTDNQIITLWTPALLSNDVQQQYNLDNVYIVFTVVPPTSKQCSTITIENLTQQEVTRYCDAWKHIVGRC
jgi:hypothetical protein